MDNNKFVFLDDLKQLKRRMKNWKTVRWLFLLVALGLSGFGLYYSFVIPKSFESLFAQHPDLAKELFPVFAAGIDQSKAALCLGFILLGFTLARWNGAVSERLLVHLAESVTHDLDASSKGTLPNNSAQ